MLPAEAVTQKLLKELQRKKLGTKIQLQIEQNIFVRWSKST